jgi:hypothetical protein
MNAREEIRNLMLWPYGDVGEFDPDPYLDAYRNEIRREAAQQIRNEGFIGPCCCGEGPDDAADLIDPEMTP